MYDNAIGLNFSILALALGFHQLTRDGYGTPGSGFDDLCIIFQGVVRDRLNGAETRAVVNVQEREITSEIFIFQHLRNKVKIVPS